MVTFSEFNTSPKMELVPPEWAVRVMNETHKRVIIAPQNWYARDFRYVSGGAVRWSGAIAPRSLIRR